MQAEEIKATVNEYIRGVESGEIVAGRLVKLAVRRHQEDLIHAGARGFVFNESVAIESIMFFPLCKQTVGEWEGEPLNLSPFQMFVTWCIFGWRKKEDGMRRFRKAYISMARKGGKSTWCAAMSLLLLFFDNPVEPGAQVYIGATKEDQANIIHKESVCMVEKSPALRELSKITVKNIAVPHNHSFSRPIGGDSDTSDGFNAHAVLKDELHAWRERHRGLHEKLDTAGGSRRQPLIVTITTAGDDKSVIWIEEDGFARRVLESAETGTIVSDSLFAFIACIDDDDDPLDEACWPKANPNIDVSIKRSYLREQATEAREKPTAMNAWRRYHCNIKTTSTERAVASHLWQECKRPLSELAGLPCHGAFDLGRSNDFAAITLCFPFETDEYDNDGKLQTRYEFISHSFTSEKMVKELTPVPFHRWWEHPNITVCRDETIHFPTVQKKLLEWNELYNVKTWAYDATFAQQMAQEIEEEGLNIFKFTQTERFYNEPLRRFLKAVKEKQIAHDGDALFAWQVCNLTIKRNNRDEWMPDKSSGAFKIDAAVAGLMAFSEVLFAEKEKPATSIYETPGNLSL